MVDCVRAGCAQQPCGGPREGSHRCRAQVATDDYQVPAADSGSVAVAASRVVGDALVLGRTPVRLSASTTCSVRLPVVVSVIAMALLAAGSLVLDVNQHLVGVRHNSERDDGYAAAGSAAATRAARPAVAAPESGRARADRPCAAERRSSTMTDETRVSSAS